MAGDDTSRLDRLIDTLERVRVGLCAYSSPHFCDCKYGFPADTRPGTEQTGCPELRDAIGFLRTFKRVLDGAPVMTADEWRQTERVMSEFREKQEAWREGTVRADGRS